MQKYFNILLAVKIDVMKIEIQNANSIEEAFKVPSKY